MKKLGTPMRAGPGVASEKLGFVGAGDPSGCVRTGAGTGAAGVVGAALSDLPEPEVEVECLTVPVPPTSPLPVLALPRLTRWWDGVELGVVVGVAVGVRPGVAVPAGAVGVVAGSPVGVLVGSGATVVFTGDGKGEGFAVCVGAAVAEDVGAAVAVCAGVDVDVTVGAAAAVDVAAGDESGVGDAACSCAGASAPRDAAKRAAPARPMARIRRVKVWSGAGAPRCG
jgi:hypothetical protein